MAGFSQRPFEPSHELHNTSPTNSYFNGSRETLQGQLPLPGAPRGSDDSKKGFLGGLLGRKNSAEKKTTKSKFILDLKITVCVFIESAEIVVQQVMHRKSVDRSQIRSQLSIVAKNSTDKLNGKPLLLSCHVHCPIFPASTNLKY